MGLRAALVPPIYRAVRLIVSGVASVAVLVAMSGCGPRRSPPMSAHWPAPDPHSHRLLALSRFRLVRYRRNWRPKTPIKDSGLDLLDRIVNVGRQGTASTTTRLRKYRKPQTEVLKFRTLLVVLRIFRSRAAAAAVPAGLLVAGAFWLVFRSSASGAGLLQALPPGDGPVLFVDFEILRKSGVLDEIAGSPAAEEADYRNFVEATGFDYRRDLDKAAVAFLPQGNFFVARGRFSFDRLARYAQVSGGRCIKDVCSLIGSSRERQISFQLLDRRTLAVGVSAVDPYSVTGVKFGNRSPRDLRGAAWLLLPRSWLRPRPGLPLALNQNLNALSPANEAALSLGEGPSLGLEAFCDDDAGAARVKAGLRGGEFRAEGKRVRGHWNLPADWWKSLTG